MNTTTGASDGLVRIKVELPRSRTTVSLDDVLHHALIEHLGGRVSADRWLKQQAVDLYVHEMERGVGEVPVEVDASLSRLVQRQALRLILGKLLPT